jgi:AcrR family transcriptional regulator
MRGYHGTSMRDITARAVVNLAAVNYHFGSKQALLDAVFERRLTPLNKIRMERLEAVREGAREQKRRPAAREVLQAFVEPTLRFRDEGPGAEDFIALVGQSFSAHDDAVRKVFLQMMVSVIMLLFELLKEALPDIPEMVLWWRLHFALGALSHTLHICAKTFQTGALDCVGGAEKESRLVSSCSEVGTNALTEMLISFAVAGLEAE